MNEEDKEFDLSKWFPTYSTLTVQRVLETLHLKLTPEEATIAVKNPGSLYFQLMRIPIKNIFNGIILQQAHDYQVYAQKLFVDYLLSGENDKGEDTPGANTREDLTNQRTQLTELGEAFNNQEFEHQKLIADSQASLIALAAEIPKSLSIVAKRVNSLLHTMKIAKTDEVVKQAIGVAMLHDDKVSDVSSLFWIKVAEILDVNLENSVRVQLVNVLDELVAHKTDIEKTLANYLERTEDMSINLREYRAQFYQAILRITELLQLLTDYTPNAERVAENLLALDFDAKIGDS